MEPTVDVKSIRAGLGLTQAQLADAVGVDQGTVSNWEKGKTTPGGPARRMLESLRSEPAQPERAA